uniref:Uncharacterized protein n=1 Tax=viral metagenome TaxID=1070528 RepID=A0A6C0EF05_9ZZZZ
MNKNDDYMNIGKSVKNLKHIYKKTTYFKSYGTSIFLFIFITLIFFLFFSYYNVKNNIHKYQSNPSEYRCHPTVIPFAGYIYPHPGMTNSQFNRSNIMYCMRETLKDMLIDILQPLEYVSQQIQKIQTINFGSLNFLQTLFSDIRNVMSGIFGLLYNLLENFFASINHIIVFLSSAFIKTVTIPLSVIYASNIVIYCMRIIAKRLLTSIITALTILGIFTVSIFIFVFCAVFFPTLIIPFVGEILAPIFATTAAVGTASIFLVTYIIIAVIYGEIAHALSIGLKISYEEAPNPPKLRPPF